MYNKTPKEIQAILLECGMNLPKRWSNLSAEQKQLLSLINWKMRLLTEEFCVEEKGAKKWVFKFKKKYAQLAFIEKILFWNWKN